MTSNSHGLRRPLCAAIAWVLCTGDATAATITVTTGADAGTATSCTLRQAITSANTDSVGSSGCVAGSGDDTIVFANALVGSTITLTQGQLAITTPLTIVGSNQTIDGAYQSRILQISSTVSASNLKLTHGYSKVPVEGNSGGAINAFNSTLTLSNVTFDHNKAKTYGGGMQINHTTLNASDVVLSNNQTGTVNPRTGGGLNINGNCTANLVRTTITGNTARSGAALYISFSTSLTVTDSTISGNTAQYGGALTTAAAGTVSFIDSTISGNSATIPGGGSTSVGGALIIDAGSPLSLVNVTMTGNTADEGGALYLSSGALATLTNTTVSANTAATMGGGGVWMTGGTLTLSNTLFAGNTATGVPTQADVKQTGGTLTATYSILGSALNAAPLNDAANHNVFTDSLGLGALANNGGSVQTRALLAGSPALGVGSVALAVDSTGHPLAYDARGLSFVRTLSGLIDIGAYESQGDRRFANGFEALP
jgi:hypothetical protein